MYQVYNLSDSPNVRVLDTCGPFTVIEHKKDLSVRPENAAACWYASQMNIRQRQVICDISQGDVIVQAGAMQWMVGDVQASSGVKGLGDLLGKSIRGKVTKESAVKPEYTGTGVMVLEPTYKHIMLVDLDDWHGSIVLEDGMFLACEASLRQSISSRASISSAVAGNEGLFNLCLSGKGVAVLESPVPKEELIEVDLQDDVIRIDGSFAIAWSSSLSFTVERTTKSLTGSMASGEGLVNVYRGTGKILLAPVIN